MLGVKLNQITPTVQKKLSMNCSNQYWTSNHEYQNRYFLLVPCHPSLWTNLVLFVLLLLCYLPRDFPLGVGPERLLVEGYCDKKISCFASSIGSGAPGLKQNKRVYHGLHGSVSEKLIDRSSLSEAYYQTSNTVDRHNQYSSLVTHGFAWHTQHYSHRVFGSVLSYIATNAFLAMKWERSSVNKEFEFSSFGDFVRALSFLAVGSPTLHFAPLASQASPAPSSVDTIALHTLENIPRDDKSNLQSRKHCAFCKQGSCRPTQYCKGCSNPAESLFVAYCHTKSIYSDGTCFTKHVIDLLSLPAADAAGFCIVFFPDLCSHSF